ncbi:origin recognition complex subunit 4 [Eurytemora carolleeae]|uniref:origin recognition complex subunit 4 n=1 Tax=Eurytemora carolleeae TaxID=1294199 RepID=UPI000C789F93|nr:origin recognition complex subunit 4 [Eurytemora carolleeae]|eukprot:XP_023324545.1 origin recognition complex subunit 4-like [Eurytemora affinis]
MVKRKLEIDVENVFSHLSKRLAGPRDDYFVGQEENLSFLLDLVVRTVDKGEGNSILVLGPHGVGKTALIRKVMSVAAESKSWSENVVVVQLNGFLQTDDKVSLKEITRQLHLENVVGDRVFGSFSDHLSFLLSSLKTGDKTSKPIIFVLEEFDLFCAHRNQTLLYNLFDTAQSRAVPICVIGVSCQIDVTELMEKRVKSRFSHRHLNLMHFLEFDQYYKVLSEMLRLDGSSETSAWNSMVESSLQKKEVKRFFEEQVFSNDKSISHMKRLLYLSLVDLVSKGETELSLETFKNANHDNCSTIDSDPIELTIKDLSIVEICILIAVKHICDIYDNEPFNFEMIYHEFIKFKNRKFSTLPAERSVLFKCWENLLSLEFILPRSGDRTRGQQLEYVLNTFHLPQTVLKRSIEKYPMCPTEVLQWLNSSMHTSGI